MSYSPITGSTDTAVHTDTQGLREGMVEIPSFDQAVQAYYARPADLERPPVLLVIQEIFGVNEHIKDICRRLAHEGYLAIAMELYQRQGDASAYEDTKSLIADIVAKVPDEQVMDDLDAAVHWADSQGGDTARLGVTGFCWGGRLTWLYAAHNQACKAAVAWYGKLVQGHGPLQLRHPVDVTPGLHAPVLGLYGGKDASIPQQDVKRMQTALAQGSPAAQASRIDVYPDAGHAFFADYRPSYRATDAQDAWRKALAWFDSHL